jgi:MFS family permease
MDCELSHDLCFDTLHLFVYRVYFESKYRLPPYPTAELCNSLIYLISIVASAGAGALVDRYGRNAQMICASVLMALGAHLTLALTFITPFVPVVGTVTRARIHCSVGDGRRLHPARRQLLAVHCVRRTRTCARHRLWIDISGAEFGNFQLNVST